MTPSNPGYQAIPSAEPGGGGGSGGEEPMELQRESSTSTSDNDNDNGNGGGGRNVVHIFAMAASAALLLLLAFLGGRSSSSSSKAPPKSAVVHLNEDVPNRLCEVYYDPKNKAHGDNARIIQTSIGAPSEQWSEVACIHHEQRKLQHTKKQHVDEDGGYARPSAIINVDFDKVAFPEREPILGFGGAFTEATALNFWSLSEEGREVALELLFGRDGLGYSLGRTHINSCDFSVESYSFDDTDGDFNLENFDTNVQHDLDSGMVDMMLLATKTIQESYPKEASEYGMRIIASPWSPPAWMKAPTWDDVDGALHAEKMTGSALPVCIRDGVGNDSKYAKSWALFFSKFISAYANHGIDFYGVTIQNEPEFPAPWDACAYDAFSEGEFIANHLGPTLSEHHPNTKILFFDHNKDHVVQWAQILLDSDHPASQYIDGTAFHWYAGGMDRLLDGAQGIPNLHRLVSELDEMENVDYDGHILLGSESCHCPSTGYAGGDINIAWARASRNAHTLLADLAAGSNGNIEWNMILDSVGGPNHLGNMCDSPLLAVPHRALDADNIPDQMDFELAGHPFGEIHGDNKTREELNAEGVPAKYLDLGIVVQPMYYYVGHITRFVRPGSRVLHGLVDGSANGPRARTFRPEEQDVPGGGINDLARAGIEVTLWPCEGSTRQEWKLNDEKQLQVFGHDWLGAPTTSCLGRKADKDMGGLMLATCDGAGFYEVVPVAESHHGRVNIVLKNSKVDSKKSCLVAQPLRNNGGAYGPRGGAQVNIGSCKVPWAEWVHDPATGEIYSTVFDQFGGEVCLTTGWPFVQVGAFDTSATGKTARTAVVLNEAGESANYVFKDKERTILTASIPPHSIQTISFD